MEKVRKKACGEKVKESNHILKNIVYYLNVWRKTFLSGLVLIVLSVPIGIIGIYENIQIPRIILRGLEDGARIELVMKQILGAFLLMMLCKILFELIDVKLKTRGSRPLMWLYSVPVQEKFFAMDYQKLITADTQEKMSKIENIVIRGADGGPIHFFGSKLSEFLIALTGLLLFTPNILQVDVLLLIVIFISALFNLGYGIYAGKYSERNMNERSDVERKELYFTKVAEDRGFSKDLRFYEMLSPLQTMFQKYHLAHAAYLKKESNVQFGSEVLNALTLLCRDVLAYGYLIYQLSMGAILISDFVFLAGLIMQFSLWMDALVKNANEMILFSAMMQQLREFIEEPEQGYFKARQEDSVVSKMPSIEFKNLSYRYPDGEHMIFENFNLKIAPGEKIALVGVNGAGKTTLIHLLLGLLHPTQGEICIDGKDANSFSKEEYYKLFSPVFQDIHVFPETIALNVAGEEQWDEKKLSNALKGAGLFDFVQGLKQQEKTPLVKESAEDAMDLSGGLNQRLLLARALYKDAKINILDEPTAALDPIAESKIYEEYDAMSRNKTSIFISHRLASTRFCDRILFLEHGKILEEGTHHELMKKHGKYFEMYEVQSKYYREEQET